MSSDHPRLEEWQWNGDKLDGLVYGKPGFKDGTPMTTSEVPEAQRFADHVVTSSGSTYMLGAPRVLQAVCRDAGWRALRTDGYEEGTRREPVRAFLLTWALVQLILLTGTINLLAPLVEPSG